MKQLQWEMKSPIGPLYLVASEKGLQAILWKKQKAEMASSLKSSEPNTKILELTVQQLNEYFAGDRTEFEIPLDQAGTHFQRKVWDELVKIPYGETTSYKQIADRLQTGAMRAVGSANGRNPLSIIVPCHRVIASNGTLAGYSGGLDKKRFLLDLEKGTPSLFEDEL